MSRIRLDIYLTEGCFACQRVEVLAADAREWFPQIPVTLHRLSTGDALPAGVVAVPAFVLDGRVIQYGTPDQGQISEAVVRALASSLGARTHPSGVEEGELS